MHPGVLLLSNIKSQNLHEDFGDKCFILDFLRNLQEKLTAWSKP
jgi:hypothetical protein